MLSHRLMRANMSSRKDFIPPLIRLFATRISGPITPETDVRTRGGFSTAAWKALVHEINALPAVKAAGVTLKPGAIAKARKVSEIADVIWRAAQTAGRPAGKPKAAPPRKKAVKRARTKRAAAGPATGARARGGAKKAALKSARKRPAASRGVKKARTSRKPTKVPKRAAKFFRKGINPYTGAEVTFDWSAVPAPSPSPAPPPSVGAPSWAIPSLPPTLPPRGPPPPAASPVSRPSAAPPPTLRPPVAARVPPEKPGLTFSLEGPQASQDEVVWGSWFEVVVRYGEIAAGMLGAIRSSKVEEAISAPSAELEIVVLPIGFALSGPPEQPLIFESGHMVSAPPRFMLTAPRRADLSGLGQGPFGISVGLKQSSTLIHSFFFEIHLVDWLSSEERITPVIDFDLKEVAGAQIESRAGIVFIMGEGDSWKVYWNIDGHSSNARVASVVTPARLKAQYDAFINDDLNKIANSALWRNVDAEMELPTDAASLGAARQVMQAAVTAGSKLYSLLSEEEIFRQALQRIDRLPDGSKIAIVTDCAVFPWELLYPLEYIDGYPEQNYKPEQLWGNRFVFESLLVAPADEKYPSNRQQSGRLHVSMGLNGSIDEEAAWSGRQLLPVGLQKEYFETTLAARGDYSVGYDQVLNVIRRTPPNASLIYFFCHGTADKLEFEKARPLTPFHILGPEFSNWALVFVNACEAGNISPLSFFSFRNTFRKRKAAGLIAPCFPIPTLFAAVFAKAFIERYVAGDTVGDIMFDLRRKLLAHNNPLGLWYSLQCPLDLKAPVN